MPRQPSIDQLIKSAGKLQEQLTNYAKRSHQTAIKDRKAVIPEPKAPKAPKLPVKRPVPPQLAKHVFKKKSK